MADKFRAINRTRATCLVERGEIAASMWARLRGLLGRAPLQAGEGLLLRGEKAIHTIGMGLAMDALFLDRDGRVVHSISAMPPLRLSPFIARAADVLELPAGTIARTATQVGDHVEIEFIASHG